MDSARVLSIAHVDTELSWRGGQQALLTLLRGLRDLGHKQILIAPPSSELAARASAEQFTVIALNGSRDLRVLFRSGRFDLAHAHSGRAQNLVYLGTLGTPVKRVVTRHVAFRPSQPWVHRVKYNLTCDAIIAVSGAVRDVLFESGIRADRITVIPTGVEIPAEVRTTPHAGFIAGHLGAFTQEKGQAVAIAAARALPDVQFLLAGEGSLLETLKKDAGPNVQFPGFVDDLDAFFAGLDVFLMPSLSEAWGLAALDAMAHGIPVIASAVGGLQEIVTPDCGWLVPPGDAQALANAIAAAAADPAQRQRIAAAGRERARSFSAGATAQQTAALYSRVLASIRG